jgi:hypothetical protein
LEPVKSQSRLDCARHAIYRNWLASPAWPGASSRAAMTTYLQKIHFGEMRTSGMRDL